MHHLTLNTGHTRLSPRSEVGDAAIKSLDPMLSPGMHDVPGFADHCVQVTTHKDRMLATLYHKPTMRPVCTLAVAPSKEAGDELWPLLVAHYAEVTGKLGLTKPTLALPAKPASEPWVAVALFMITPLESDWTGDLERCLAWAWIERVTKSN